MTTIYKQFPDELASVFNDGAPTNKYYRIFQSTNLATPSNPAPDTMAPAIGTFWKAALDNNVYRVLTIAQGEHEYEVVLQETDGEVFTIPVEDFNGMVRIISPAEDVENQVVPRFEVVTEIPNEWKWWYPTVQKIKGWWTRLFPGPRNWTPAQVFENLHGDKTTPLWAINASNTNHGQANLIFTFMGDGQNARQEVGTFQASWYPVDISKQFPRDSLRHSTSFLNLLNKKLVIIVSPSEAKRIMATDAAREEKKRMDVLLEHVKAVGSPRTLEQANVEITNADGRFPSDDE
jgi:hypothetical protein